MKFWQFPMLLSFLLAFSALQAEEEPKFAWEPLDIRTSIFSQDLVMMGSERDEYATNLATYAANRVLDAGASPESLAQARRLLALAMHLSPRNKQAVVTQYQLAKGIVPEKTSADYSPQVLARLLLTRGQLLSQQVEEENTALAHYLIQLAAEIDPRNEDAVYASEILRIDKGAPDWSKLTSPKKQEETP